MQYKHTVRTGICKSDADIGVLSKIGVFPPYPHQRYTINLPLQINCDCVGWSVRKFNLCPNLLCKFFCFCNKTMLISTGPMSCRACEFCVHAMALSCTVNSKPHTRYQAKALYLYHMKFLSWSKLHYPFHYKY